MAKIILSFIQLVIKFVCLTDVIKPDEQITAFLNQSEFIIGVLIFVIESKLNYEKKAE